MEFTTAQLIAQLYVGYYNRAPDPEGLNYWIGRVNAGVTLSDIADSFAASPEAISTYPYLALPNVVSPEAFVTQIYQNLFNRAPDADGLAYYTGQLEDGTITAGQLIASIQANANTNPNNDDGTILGNKVEVALAWTNAAAATPGFEYDEAAAASANSILDNVDETDESVEEALEEIENGVDIIGRTFTLTTAAGEQVLGTTGNDQINIVVGTGATLNVFDEVDGAAGDDTANIITDAAITAAQLGQLTSVETVNVNTTAAAGQTALDISGQNDIRSFNLSGTGMATGAALTVGANQTVTLAGDVTDNDVTVTAVDDVTELNVNGNDTAIDEFTLTGADVTTVNVGGTTSGTVAIVAPATAETVNVSIANNVALTVTGAAIDTLNLSGAGGTVSVTALEGMTSVVGSAQADAVTDATFTEAFSATLGAGNDTFIIADGDAASTVSVALGAGSDTVDVNALANLDADDIDATLISITDFNVNDDVLDLVGIIDATAGFVDLTNVQQTNISAATTLEAAFTLAAAAAGADGTVAFDYDGDAYIFHNDGTAALADTDGAIKLTGVSVNDLDASNFVLA